MNEKVIIYCDGACRGNQTDNTIGGWGATIEQNNKKECISGGARDTTNNRMEMMACIQALNRVQQTNKLVQVHTDSAYLCNCINQKWYVKWQNNGWINSKKKPVENKDLWEQLLYALEIFTKIDFIKVKGHSGNAGNDKADQLANDGADRVEINSLKNEPYLDIPIKEDQFFEPLHKDSEMGVDRVEAERISNNITNILNLCNEFKLTVQNLDFAVKQDLDFFMSECTEFEKRYQLMKDDVKNLLLLK